MTPDPERHELAIKVPFIGEIVARGRLVVMIALVATIGAAVIGVQVGLLVTFRQEVGVRLGHLETQAEAAAGDRAIIRDYLVATRAACEARPR